MAGWESKRHSARHAIVVKLVNPSAAAKVLVDTCIFYIFEKTIILYDICLDMHSCNNFQFITILAGNFDGIITCANLLLYLPIYFQRRQGHCGRHYVITPKVAIEVPRRKDRGD